MLRKRLIICIDVRDGKAVKPVRLTNGGDATDPAAVAMYYESVGADEVLLRDVSAETETRQPLLDAIQRTAESLTVPLTIGGGIRDADDVGAVLRAGAKKVCLNTAAVLRPETISEASQRYGKHSIVLAISARAERRQIEILARPDNAPADMPGAAAPLSWFRIFTHNGTTATQLDAVVWSRQCEELGAGELIVSNIDRLGDRGTYDLELTARIVEAVRLSVIAGGSACRGQDVRDAFLLAGADAAVIGHGCTDGSDSIAAIKRALALSGVPVRLVEESQLRA